MLCEFIFLIFCCFSFEISRLLMCLVIFDYVLGKIIKKYICRNNVRLTINYVAPEMTGVLLLSVTQGYGSGRPQATFKI